MLNIRDIRTVGGKGKGQSKDLQRLNRQDLLELLVGQMHEADDLRGEIAVNKRVIEDGAALADRLKEKLNLKDDQIEHLKEKLDLKDGQMDYLKDKLNLKDAQIEHLKVKLDDKDELIEKLKHRLDLKDELIARLSDSTISAEDAWAIYEAKERTAELEQQEKASEASDE